MGYRGRRNKGHSAENGWLSTVLSLKPGTGSNFDLHDTISWISPAIHRWNCARARARARVIPQRFELELSWLIQIKQRLRNHKMCTCRHVSLLAFTYRPIYLCFQSQISLPCNCRTMKVVLYSDLCFTAQELCEGRGGRLGLPVPNRLVFMVSVDVNTELNYYTLRGQELCESRGGRPGLPVPNSLYGLCECKATLGWTDLCK